MKMITDCHQTNIHDFRSAEVRFSRKANSKRAEKGFLCTQFNHPWQFDQIQHQQKI